MDFYAVLDEVLELLQRHKRVTYRALKRQFGLDDTYLEDLKAEIIEARQLAVDQDGTMLVWCGDVASPPPPAAAPVSVQSRAPLAYTPKHWAKKILTSRSALEGERKQVTVLFADVAGFTTLAEQLDPEVVHDLINRCFEGITAEVHRFAGTINPYTGDGVMALFGAPLAHEDSPRRAVHAALGIQRAIRDVAQTLQAERGLSLQMRIGVNTGLVVVGKIGDDLRMDYTAVGDTTNLAARLQQTAQPGSVVISAATQQHIAGFFETRDLGEMPVKGRATVRAFEVLRPRGRRTRFDVAVERGLTSLVGREQELATLRERFREVKAGRGQVVGIAGEAGMGKSRLALEFRRALAQAGEAVTWLEGHCISFGQASPFLPLIEQLRENFQIDEFDGEPEIIAKVEQGPRLRERFGRVFLPAVCSRAYLAWCHAELGAFAEGRALGEEGLRIAEVVGHSSSLMMASWGVGLLALRQGDLPRALPLFEQAVSLCQDADLPLHFPRVAAALGVAYTLSGRVADAIPLLTQAIEQTTVSESRGLYALCRLPLGEEQVLASRLEEVQALAECELALARAHQERGNQAYALRLLGEIAAHSVPPEVEQAEAFYRQALALADELGMRPLLANCHSSLGILYTQIGRPEQARAELSVAIELYRTMEMTFRLERAEMALVQGRERGK